MLTMITISKLKARQKNRDKKRLGTPIIRYKVGTLYALACSVNVRAIRLF